MKIGFDAKRAFNNRAGLGNFSRNTIRALTSYYPGDQYILFTPRILPEIFKVPVNSRVVTPEMFWWKMLQSPWRSFRLASLAKKHALDLYHGLSHELPVGIEKTGIKTIVTIHDLIFLRYPELYKKADRAIYNKKFRHACRVATTIHAISEQTKADLISQFHVPEQKIKVIYQTINPDNFQKIPEEEKKAVLRKYQIPTEFILNVGTIEPRKNLLALLEGMVSANIHIPLIVAGTPTSYLKPVQEFISRHKLNVHFISEATDSEIRALYQSAQLMAYPSVFEGFGLPVAEAQACGCPVVTSSASSLPEAGGAAALYADPRQPQQIGDQLKKILDDSDLKNKLITDGKSNAMRFSDITFARQMNELYKTLAL